jgi:hypothetical protein
LAVTHLLDRLAKQFAMQALVLWVANRQQRAVSPSALSSRYRLVIDLGDLQPADP